MGACKKNGTLDCVLVATDRKKRIEKSALDSRKKCNQFTIVRSGGRCMKNQVIGGLAISALLLAAPLSGALAADMAAKAPPSVPLAPVYCWTGFYVGLDAGGAWARDVVSPTIADGGTFPRSNTLSSTGALGGGTLGYNFQAGSAVFGVEGDLGGMATGTQNGDPHGGTEIDFIKGGFYADATGRLGFVASNVFLLYAKGGYAFYDGTARTTSGLPGFTVGNSGTFNGWTAGGGIEYKMTANLSAKVEYLYYDFGSETATLTSAAGVFPYSNSLKINTVKIGLNYAFH
jgi:outer membrane immunogenic protein